MSKYSYGDINHTLTASTINDIPIQTPIITKTIPKNISNTLSQIVFHRNLQLIMEFTKERSAYVVDPKSYKTRTLNINNQFAFNDKTFKVSFTNKTLRFLYNDSIMVYKIDMYLVNKNTQSLIDINPMGMKHTSGNNMSVTEMPIINLKEKKYFLDIYMYMY